VAEAAAPPEVRATERWFIRQGLPMFVEEYSAGRDVWTRALPVLALLFVVSILTGTVAADTVRGAVLLVLVAMLALGAYAAWNRTRGRSAFALPPSVGIGWLIAFVAVPALASLAVSRDLVAFWGDLAVGAVVLGLVYIVTRYALVAQLGWALRWTFRQLSSVTRLITRVLPLMLLFITFLFINTEVWQVAGTMSAAVLWGSLAVFAVVGVLFIVGRSREEFQGIEVTTDREQLLDLTHGTPMADVAHDLPGLDEPVPMRTSQRANLVAVMVTAQAVQVGLVGIVVWAFFVIFGAVAISIPVQEAWLAGLGPVDVLLPLGDGHGVTRSLLRVSTFLGGFAAFYATVYAASDPVYRDHFVGRITATVERAVAVRRVYLALRRREGLQVDVPAPRPHRARPADETDGPPEAPDEGPEGGAGGSAAGGHHPPVGPRGL